MHIVLDNQRTGLGFWLYKFLCGCCLEKDDYWVFKRAPEPSDVNWENMGLTWTERQIRQFLSIAGTFATILVTFALIIWIEQYGNEVEA
jgi:hypothetical protein